MSTRRAVSGWHARAGGKVLADSAEVRQRSGRQRGRKHLFVLPVCGAEGRQHAYLRGTSLAWALLGAQATVAAVATFVVWVVSGRAAAVAALFGGVVAVAPSAWFTIAVYLRADRFEPAQILGAIYRAEMGKLILTGALFWVGALLFGNHFAPLIITCMACLSMNWVMLAVAKID